MSKQVEPLSGLVEPNVLAIFSALFNHPSQLYHLNSLAQTATVPVSTTSRIITRLVQEKFAEEVIVGKIILYKLAQNKKVELFKKLYTNEN
ncbi:hypothetical protein HZC30_08050 [Candidatus Woesearchaeota archaeon]|nr:hypothetical protein [Candidatus Woesearchaeota archaeon]